MKVFFFWWKHAEDVQNSGLKKKKRVPGMKKGLEIEIDICSGNQFHDVLKVFKQENYWRIKQKWQL